MSNVNCDWKIIFLKREKKLLNPTEEICQMKWIKPTWAFTTVVGFNIWAEYIPNTYIYECINIIKYSHENTKY